MLALNLYTTPSNNGGIVLYLDVDLGHMEFGPQNNYFCRRSFTVIPDKSGEKMLTLFSP